ncbi:MAG TPA: uroporphyrinogen decarboxylase family protein [Vicinamibacteria bacterium]|nr:uroporphyrinogen decarboxylase family protein [Vicinamibacteria bacterium]
MNPRERWRAVLEGRTPDRVPCDYWGTAEVTERLKRELDCPTERALWERLSIDKCIHIAPVHPGAGESDWHMQSLFSIWGVGTVDVPHEGGGVYREAVSFPLASAGSVADVERFAWPRPDALDYSGLRALCAEWRDHPILCGSSEPFYLYCRLRGMEQALLDLVENPALAEAILEHIFLFDEGVLTRILAEVGSEIDFVYLAEDLGTQKSLIVSPRTFRRFLKPRLEKLCALVHSRGVRVFHHDDGAMRPLLPDLVEAGIDLLNPLQWRCPGMEREALAREFGTRVAFHGGVDNQQTLPFGTPSDVRAEVLENLRIFRDCRYVVAPCHNIQAVTPTANIVALYEAVAEAGGRG